MYSELWEDPLPDTRDSSAGGCRVSRMTVIEDQKARTGVLTDVQMGLFDIARRTCTSISLILTEGLYAGNPRFPK